MGLIKNDKYIRIDLYGNYYIYNSKKDRLAEKKATTPELVKQKYIEIITNLRANAEALYYKETFDLLNAWEKEFLDYIKRDISNKFPLMKAHIKDVAKTISPIVDAGKISVRGKNLDEVYDYVKKYKIFGETEDDL